MVVVSSAGARAALPRGRRAAQSITVLIPAHDEGTIRRDGIAVGAPLLETLAGLRAQTRPVSRVIVLADNCTDDTEDLAREAGAEVFVTQGNTQKKAGALNQWLELHLAEMDEDELILVMDADSVLDPEFVASAMNYVGRGYHCVGGIFQGKDGGGFVGTMQRNEYARYARDVARKQGRTLVLTGTATVFTTHCLQEVLAARADGRLPGTGARTQVYDTKALTEDNELTFALLHLGYRIIAPPECALRTEVMETWGELARQRYRWKRGAIENNSHYGLTRFTARYWGLQIWGLLGIAATLLYFSTLVLGVVTGSLSFHIIWIAITVLYAVERVLTVRSRGWRQMLLSAVLVIEMPYDIFLQAVQIRAFAGALFRTRKSW